ncbi:MAG: class I SAM-dependent methyltransferase [Acidimicrobiales bacterium]
MDNRRGTMERSFATIIRSAFGADPPLQVHARGRRSGPDDAPTRLVVRREEALAHLVRAPGELGLARAYVSGALDIEGDLFGALRARATGDTIRLGTADRLRAFRQLGIDPWRHPPTVPPEEVDLGGRMGRHSMGRHSIGRDRRAISHHYDVGNQFYELLLGPSMVYSCAVFEDAADTLEQAQFNKMELICRKLGLRQGLRLLDVGCGWGSLVLHAARLHDVHAVGITLSAEQADYARLRVAAAGLGDRIEIRLCDYREMGSDRFDAISSVGMAEHVGRARLGDYFTILRGLLRDQGRLLNHQIGIGPDPTRPAGTRTSRLGRDGFMNRYVFPDGELHDVGELVAVAQEQQLEVRHVESIREHYALTARAWVANLEAGWERAVGLVGEGRARVWRLYLVGSALGFELGSTQVHQVLAVRTPLAGTHRGRSGQPWRPLFEREPLSATRNPDQITDQITGQDPNRSGAGTQTDHRRVLVSGTGSELN